MFSVSLAEKALLKVVPYVTIQDHIVYRDLYLFRITFASEAEKNYDPFFSVDMNTGEVKDFSVITDGDISEITKLFLHNKTET